MQLKAFSPFFCHHKKAVLWSKAFTKSTLPFWECMIEVFIHLIVEAPFIYLRQIKQDAYWTIVFDIVPVFTSSFFNSKGKVESIIESLKFKKNFQKKYLRYLLSFSLIYHFLDKLFCYLDYGSLFKILFLASKINENFISLPPVKFLIFCILEWFSFF